MAFEVYIVGAAVFIGALPVGGKLGFQEVSEILSEGGFFGCEGEVHRYIPGAYDYWGSVIIAEGLNNRGFHEGNRIRGHGKNGHCTYVGRRWSRAMRLLHSPARLERLKGRSPTCR